jgi:hypothetical protein
VAAAWCLPRGLSGALNRKSMDISLSIKVVAATNNISRTAHSWATHTWKTDPGKPRSRVLDRCATPRDYPWYGVPRRIGERPGGSPAPAPPSARPAAAVAMAGRKTAGPDQQPAKTLVARRPASPRRPVATRSPRPRSDLGQTSVLGNTVISAPAKAPPCRPRAIASCTMLPDRRQITGPGRRPASNDMHMVFPNEGPAGHRWCNR